MEKVVPKNILLVDDHQRFLTVLASELNDSCSNFCILTAENGEKALKVLESAHVDLVVTDLNMPVMDGFQLVSHMKERYPSIPVIVMSSLLVPEVETYLRAKGVSECIEKSSISTLEKVFATIPLFLPGREMG